MNRRSALGVLGAGLGSVAFVPLRPVTFSPAALGRVRIGMTAAEARAIVGGPFDVLTRRDPELSLSSNVVELWCFGSATHGDVPLHGSVGFNVDRRVAYISGARPPIATGLNERSQRALWALLAKLSGLEGHRHDPLALIRAVNALHALQKGPAIAALREYLRVAPGPMAIQTDGIFLALRALLDPRIAPPPMLVGAPDVSNPQAASGFASFPLALWGDVPVMLVGGYMLGGAPQPVSDHLDWFEQHGRFRSSPLQPDLSAFVSQMTAAQPALSALDGGNAARAQGRRIMLAEQLLCAVSAVYSATPWRGLAHFDPAIDPMPSLQSMLRAMQQQAVAWRGDQFARGAIAPAVQGPPPRRARYLHRAPPLNLELFIEQPSPGVMRAQLNTTRATSRGALVDASLQLYAGASLVARFAVTPGSAGSNSVSEFAVPPGVTLSVRFEQGGRTVEVPVSAAPF